MAENHILSPESISKIILITQNHLGDENGFCNKYHTDYVGTDFPSYGYVLNSWV
jgi:hypothetical protein